MLFWSLKMNTNAIIVTAKIRTAFIACQSRLKMDTLPAKR